LIAVDMRPFLGEKYYKHLKNKSLLCIPVSPSTLLIHLGAWANPDVC